jgi:aspartyl protease family protein
MEIPSMFNPFDVQSVLAAMAITIGLTACAEPDLGSGDNRPSSLEPHDEHGGPGEPGWETGKLVYGSKGPMAHTGVAMPPVGSPSVVENESRDEIRLRAYNGVFAVTVVINGAVSIPFVLDSGSADVQLPAEVVFTLIRTDTLSEEDFIGASSYVLADGRTLRSARFNIREMRLGEHVVRNVTASISPAVSSDALLGQSFLSKLPSWTLDNKRHVLILVR